MNKAHHVPSLQRPFKHNLTFRELLQKRKSSCFTADVVHTKMHVYTDIHDKHTHTHTHDKADTAVWGCYHGIGVGHTSLVADRRGKATEEGGGELLLMGVSSVPCMGEVFPCGVGWASSWWPWSSSGKGLAVQFSLISSTCSDLWAYERNALFKPSPITV